MFWNSDADAVGAAARNGFRCCTVLAYLRSHERAVHPAPIGRSGRRDTPPRLSEKTGCAAASYSAITVYLYIYIFKAMARLSSIFSGVCFLFYFIHLSENYHSRSTRITVKFKKYGWLQKSRWRQKTPWYLKRYTSLHNKCRMKMKSLYIKKRRYI